MTPCRYQIIPSLKLWCVEPGHNLKPFFTIPKVMGNAAIQADSYEVERFVEEIYEVVIDKDFIK